MADFRKLEVWNKAHALALNVHRVAMRVRGAEYLTLRSQMIRAAGSIDANIVEGRSQKSDRQFLKFLNIAVNSANELEAHLIMALDLRVMGRTDYLMLLEKLKQVRRMLHGLIKHIESKSVSHAVPEVPHSVRRPASD